MQLFVGWLWLSCLHFAAAACFHCALQHSKAMYTHTLFHIVDSHFNLMNGLKHSIVCLLLFEPVYYISWGFVTKNCRMFNCHHNNCVYEIYIDHK
jgi:hypothetical protein